MADKYADRIATELVTYLTNSVMGLACKEVYHDGFRSDVLFINHELDFIDFEIKTSVADYKNDFFKTNKNGDNKHDLYNIGGLYSSFYFVFPPNLILTNDVPDVYGIYHYYGGGSFNLVREPCQKWSIHEDEIFNSLALYLSKRREFYLLSNHFNSISGCIDYENFELNKRIKMLEEENNALIKEIGKLKYITNG
jgi:hypothetical protein